MEDVFRSTPSTTLRFCCKPSFLADGSRILMNPHHVAMDMPTKMRPSLVEVAGGMNWMRQTVKEAHAQMESHLQLFHLLPMQSNGWME